MTCILLRLVPDVSLGAISVPILTPIKDFDELFGQCLGQEVH